MTTLNMHHSRYPSQIQINYLFFGFYFFCIACIHLYHVFLIEAAPTFSRVFFIFYSLGQCLVETLLLVLIADGVKFLFGIRGLYGYSLGVFFLLLSHFIDFPLVRFMDMSVWSIINFLSQESARNFLEILYASNVSILIWVVSVLIGLGLLISGLFLFKLSERWAARRPLVTSSPWIAMMLGCMGLLLLSWEYSTQQHLDLAQFDLYQKTLPWKGTFISQKQDILPLEFPLKAPNFHKVQIDQAFYPSPATRPDIFLFVIESLREDFINETNSPHLNAFKQSNISFDLALSNANATHISWFSLFHSQFPLYWGKIDPKESKGGSVPLQLLKQMGYKIQVYSSARLAYYQMDEIIFGDNAHLADEINFYEKGETCDRDCQVMADLVAEMKNSKMSGGRLFMMFLDSTHLDYSWPKDFSPLFEPYELQINYFKAALTNRNVEKIKNRYRNSLYFIDTLFGQFFDALQAYQGGDEAIVVITSDHGEEFYEQGHLFHASCLSHQQTHVPLYYKFGQSDLLQRKRERSMSCHMDIFPTIFHYLTGQVLSPDFVQGQSIFQPERWPYTVIGRYNASRPPCEFCIHNGKEKMTAMFSDHGNIYHSKSLKILSTKDLKDQTTFQNSDALKQNFGKALEHIFAP